MIRPKFLEFVWLPTFQRTSSDLLDEEDRRALELSLVEDPERGPVIPRTGGFRKLRWSAKGKGKSGGARIIYYYVRHRERIYLVLAYAKGVKEDLTEAQRASLRDLARIIKQESE